MPPCLGGWIEGPGGIEYGRTMAFTTLMFFQLFNAFNARSEMHSAFRGLFQNGWLWAAVSLSASLHMLVIYVPFLRTTFGTVKLDRWDWIRSIVVASSVLRVVEMSKFTEKWLRRTGPGRAAPTSHLLRGWPVARYSVPVDAGATTGAYAPCRLLRAFVSNETSWAADASGFHEKASLCQRKSLRGSLGDRARGLALLRGEPPFLRRGGNPWPAVEK